MSHTLKNFVIALSGSMGSGKSTLAKFLKSFSIPIFSSDMSTHGWYNGALGSEVIEGIRAISPSCIINGRVNRQKLSRNIQETPSLLAEVEAIVHPAVARERNRFLARFKDQMLVFLEEPLLFKHKNQFDHIVDYSILCECDEDIRKERVLSRKFMTEKRYEFMEAQQMPLDEKRALADFTIDTSHEDLVVARHSLSKIIEDILFKNVKQYNLWRTNPSRERDLKNGRFNLLRDIRAFSIDLDDTLFSYKSLMRHSWHLATQYLGPGVMDPNEYWNTFRRLLQEDPTLHVRHNALMEAALKETLGPDFIQVAGLMKGFNEHIDSYLYEDGVRFMQAAKEHNYGLAITSNGSYDIRNSPILSDLNPVYYSSPICGGIKPSPVPFIFVASKLNLRPWQIVHIGNNAHSDVVGARRAGMVPILFGRSSSPQLRKQAFSFNARMISNFNDIWGFLNSPNVPSSSLKTRTLPPSSVKLPKQIKQIKQSKAPFSTQYRQHQQHNSNSISTHKSRNKRRANSNSNSSSTSNEKR